jgi:diguanylate cyclase (GGDEF)-like protein/PAS domain S-box-containing protein
MLIHTPTMFLVIVTTSFTLALAIAWISYRKNNSLFNPLFMWSLALALHGGAYLLFSLRGYINDAVSIIVGNSFLSAGFALFGEAIYRFHDEQPNRLTLWAPVVFIAISFSMLLDNQQARLVISALVFTLQSADLLAFAIKMRNNTIGRGQYIIETGLVSVIAAMMLREISFLLGSIKLTSIAESNAIQSYTFITVLVSLLLLSIGFVLMTHERAEKRALDNQAFAKFSNKILDLLSLNRPLDDILNAIVNGIERLHPEMLCSILLLDKRGRFLSRIFAPSLPEFYNSAIQGVEIGLGVGSCGTAAYTKQRVIAEKIATHPYWVSYKELALQAGLASCWSQPVLSSNQKVLGTFAIYHRDEHAPESSDIELIEAVAKLASVAIERSSSVEQLRESEKHYRLLIETANEGICVVNDGVLRYANPKLCELTGYDANTLTNKSIIDLIYHEDQAMVIENQKKLLLTTVNDLKYAIRISTRHRGVRWFELSGVAFEWHGDNASLNFLTDIHDRKLMDEKIQQLAYLDALTQLPNRRLLIEHLKQALARNIRNASYSALLFLDLDNFKPLNDKHGHNVGDMLLIEVARRLQLCVRQTDTVARFGGDEFVILITDMDADESSAHTQAESIAKKILSVVADPYLLQTDNNGTTITVEHRCTASIGVVTFNNGDSSGEKLLDRADAAMYRAKQEGRNTIRFYQ